MNIEGLLAHIKGVIFDMDGTLLDSMDVWKQIDMEFLGQRKLEPIPDMARLIEGMSFHETALFFQENYGLPESIEQIEAIWHQMALEKYEKEIQLKPGVLEFLQELKKRKIRLGIATSNSRELTEICLRVHGIWEYFDAVITGNDVTHGKPDPEIYLTAADTMKVFPSECLVFEDVVMGLMAGIAAGMKTCAVYDVFTAGSDEEKRSIADYYISSFEELNGD